MKNKKKHIRILILMITSQVLLTTFVFQWLRSQFRDESQRLADELFTTYIDTQDQLIDTLLFKNYVGPVLSQHDGNRTVMIAANDSLIKDSSHKTQVNGNIVLNEPDGMVMIRMHHTADSSSKLTDTINVRSMNKDFLLRSVKMIVKHTNDSAGSSTVIKSFDIHPDTAVFRQNFSKNLEEKGMRFNLLWVKSNAQLSHTAKRLYLNPGGPFRLPGVTVTNYQGYVIRNITPQISFGIILIILTAMAFWFSSRSLKEHVVFNDMRNEFISNMTHELKTPVATIGIALESLSKYNLKDNPEVMEEYLRLAASETKRLGDLISRVLDHSVLEENASPGNMLITGINPILQEIASMMQSGMEKGTIELNAEDSPLKVLCDPLMIKGVMINLIDNSIKYCDKIPVIRISSRKEHGNAVITVSDNGPGIPFEYHTKIFEKFFRLPSGNVHNVKGYGLGLSFAALVVKLHRGTISIVNNDVGCSFIIKLPLA